MSHEYDYPFCIPSQIRELKSYIDTHLTNYKRIKIAFSTIEFSCFKRGGNCFKKSKTSMCCCTQCYNNAGHFTQTDVVEQKDIKLYDELFFQKIGFWRETGCSLPYEKRSITCVTYHCEKAEDSRSTVVSSLRKELSNSSQIIQKMSAALLSRHIMTCILKRKTI